MAYIKDSKLWESEFDNIVSKKDIVQDLKIGQLKLEVHVSYKKDENLTTKYEPTDDRDVISKTYLHEKISEVDGHLSFSDKKITTNFKYLVTNNIMKRFQIKEFLKRLYKDSTIKKCSMVFSMLMRSH